MNIRILIGIRIVDRRKEKDSRCGDEKERKECTCGLFVSERCWFNVWECEARITALFRTALVSCTEDCGESPLNRSEFLSTNLCDMNSSGSKILRVCGP